MRSSASSRTDTEPGLTPAVLAGVVAGLVGFLSAFAVVLTGLRTVGASPDEAASGLLVVSVTMGAGSILLSWRERMPVLMAWSTPGAALLASAALPDGGYGAAVSAFLVAAGLYVVTALVRPLGRLVAAIPAPIANAMLAGILLSLCVQPFTALVADPAAIAPVVVTWLVLVRLAPRWAVPGALLAAVAVVVAPGSLASVTAGDLAPVLTWTAPSWHPAAAVSLGIPLYLVTMTSQNIPGVTVLRSFGYDAPLRPALLHAGVAGLLTAPAGGYSINLAAISAAIAAGPSAHPDPDKRWVGGLSSGVTVVLLGAAASAVAAVAVAAPDGVVVAVAGLALLGALGSAAGAALADPLRRDAAALTFVVAASGIVVGGIGAAFWALVAGGGYLLLTRRPSAVPASGAAGASQVSPVNRKNQTL